MGTETGSGTGGTEGTDGSETGGGVTVTGGRGEGSFTGGGVIVTGVGTEGTDGTPGSEVGGFGRGPVGEAEDADVTAPDPPEPVDPPDVVGWFEVPVFPALFDVP